MTTFDSFDLAPCLQRAIAEEKYVTPTTIQSQAIPPGLAGQDVMGCAQTGTGKTAAFALPILDRLSDNTRKARPGQPRALVLAPTRELALQIEASFKTYGRHAHLRFTCVYGGVSQHSQVRALRRGVHVLVATPGRLLDLMEQGHVDLGQLEFFVLDEADRMLDMGFLPDLKRIFKVLPDQRQSFFFSATMPPEITRLSQTLLNDPAAINVNPKSSSVKNIDQRIVFVERRAKTGLLKRILTGDGVESALVFTKTKRGANALADKLLRRGVTAAAIHGNKSQAARQHALSEFRSKRVQVLVATDVAARGIDIDGISHVFNFDLPDDPANYVHRIGRTGRAGATGTAFSFCASHEHSELRAIEKLLGAKVPIADIEVADAAESEANTKPAHAGRGARNRKVPPKSNRGRKSRSRKGEPTLEKTSTRKRKNRPGKAERQKRRRG